MFSIFKSAPKTPEKTYYCYNKSDSDSDSIQTVYLKVMSDCLFLFDCLQVSQTQESQTQVSRWSKYLDTPQEAEPEEEEEEEGNVLMDRQQLHGSDSINRCDFRECVVRGSTTYLSVSRRIIKQICFYVNVSLNITPEM